MNPNFQRLVRLFQKLPGVGPRQAARFVLALLDKSRPELEEFGEAIGQLKDSIRFCRQCFNLSDDDLCSICRDTRRDQTKILVVEKVTDLTSIERTGLYKGLYHVLGGALNPVDGIGPEQLTIRQLNDRLVAASHPIELVLATNPSTAGETTSLYLRDYFGNRENISLTRLARGLASGSYLEYADELTLKNALEYRK